jgi:calcineurin-like phosphoesterase
MAMSRSGSVKGDVIGDFERVGSFMAELGAQQERILERMERLVELNEQMWDHHLQFCGRLIESISQTEVQLLDAQSDLTSQLDALRGAVDRKG